MNSFYIVAPSNTYDETHKVQLLTKQLWECGELVQVKWQAKEKYVQEMTAARQEWEELSKSEKKVKEDLQKLLTKVKGVPNKEQTEEMDRLKGILAKIDDANAKMIKLTQSNKLTTIVEEFDDAVKVSNRKMEQLAYAERNLKKNKTNDFWVQLPQHVELTGEGWKVAVVQFTYPRSWNNINEPPEGVPFTPDYAQNCIEVLFHNERWRVWIPAGFYETPETLLNLINSSTEHRDEIDGVWVKNEEQTHDVIRQLQQDWFHLKYDKMLNRFSIEVFKDTTVKLSTHMKYMLGFDEKQVAHFKEGISIAKYPPDLRGGIDSLYLYCDIVEPQIIGNVKAPLLRTVGVDGKPGDVVDEVFQAPHYIPVAQKSFSTLHLSINTDANEPVPFQYGKTVVKLHFVQNKRGL